MMVLNNEKVMGSIITFNKKEFKINCKDEGLTQKIIKLEQIINENISNNKGWSNEDYLNFFRQLSKVRVQDFIELYDHIMYLLELELDQTEEIIRNLSNKLNLGVFDDDRKVESLKTTKIVNGKEVEKTIPKIIYTKHIFTTADIVLFFQRLNSEVNKFNNVLLEDFEKRYGSDILAKKEENLQKEIEEFCNDSELFEIIVKQPYLKWVQSISEEDFIYIYLINKISHIKTQNLMHLKLKLLKYKKQEEDAKYKREQKSNYLTDVARYNQKTQGLKKSYTYIYC